MKDWFPLTDYEFYAFVSAGMLLVASVDYCLADGHLVGRTEWSFVEVVFWIVVSYLAGQMCASASSIALEQFLTRRLLHSPVEIIAGLCKRRWLESAASFIGAAQREYSPLPEPLRQKLLDRVSHSAGYPIDKLTAETIFEISFSLARSNSDSAARLDKFINSYGLCRNVSFAALIAAALLTWRYLHHRNDQDLILLISASVTSVGMYGRFLKYFSAYTREVLRTYANMRIENGTKNI